MKLLHLEASTGWGGQEIRILREAEGMRKRGHEIILGVMKGGELIARARAAGFTVYELNFKRLAWPVCCLRLLTILRRHKIDLVNTHSSLDAWIGGIAGRLAGKKIVRTRHLSTPIKKGWNSRFVYGKLCDFVVTTCSAIIPMICEQSGKRVDQCRSIATGVDPEKMQVKSFEVEEFRRKWNIGPTDLLVGSACSMRSWKGIDDFLKAADLLRNEPGLKWVIIGGGHAETYKKRAKEMDLEKIVQFTGYLDNPFPGLAALDVFTILSTAHEGVSQAILQAAYLKKPLIATATGGLCEVCKDRETGLQVSAFSPRQVADAILYLKENRSFCEKLGQSARALVEEKFTVTHMLNEMEKVYTARD